MNKTENFELNIPTDTDFYNVEDFNENFRKIDQNLMAESEILEQIGNAKAEAENFAEEKLAEGKAYTDQKLTEGKVYTDEKIEVVNGAVGEINSNLPFGFGIDADGNYGYVKVGADSVIPFRSKPLIFTSSPVDIKAVLPDVWDKLTVDDFMVGCVSSSCLNTVGNSFFQGSLNPGVAKPSITYSNDGLLTIKNYSYRFTHTGTGANYWDFKTIGAFAVYKGTVGGK